jgi:uncharacterized surface anchored protein
MRTAGSTIRRHPWLTVLAFVLGVIAAAVAIPTTAAACDTSVVIRKVETGAGAPGGTYTILMTGADFRREVTVAAGGEVTIPNVPPGTYTFEELGAPTGATIVPNPITIAARQYDQEIEVLATNPYPAARLAIAKVETGDTAPGGTYTFAITGPVELEATVTAGETWTSDWLPLGTYTVTEVDAPDGATIEPNPVVLDTDGATVTVTATNPYPDHQARLAITKVETGEAAPGGTYTFMISGSTETGTLEFPATVTAGETWTSDWLPLGTYTVTERDAPAGATIEPNPVVLDTDGATVTVTATNPYPDYQARLAITKVIAGGGSTPAGPWTLDITGPVDMTVTISTGETWTSDWLPLGTYTVTERDAPAGATIEPNPVVLDTDGATVAVTVTNPAVESEGATTTTTAPPTTTTTTAPRILAATGTDATTLPLVAGLLVLAGIAAVTIVPSRRRR